MREIREKLPLRLEDAKMSAVPSSPSPRCPWPAPSFPAQARQYAPQRTGYRPCLELERLAATKRFVTLLDALGRPALANSCRTIIK